MAAARLVLRYRNFQPAVDTIDEHERVLRERKHVWWGWWRKSSEPKQAELISSILSKTPFRAWLIDNEERRQTLAIVDKIVFDLGQVDVELVPEYYRGSSEKVPVWFRIAELQPMDYDEAIGSALGEPTLYQISESGHVMFPTETEKAVEKLKANAAATVTSKELVIVHLSDLHVGPDHNFRLPSSNQLVHARRSLADCLCDDLQRQSLHGKIDAIVISGDLVSRANWGGGNAQNLESVIRAISEQSATPLDRFVITPGNHDFERFNDDGTPKKMSAVQYAISMEHEMQFRWFLQRLLGVSDNAPLNRIRRIKAADFELRIGALNSCKITASEFTEYGYVGEDIRRIASEMRGDGPAVRMLVMHHHLTPIRSVEIPKINGVSITLDAHEILDKAQESGVRLVLHGHQHQPNLGKVANAYIRSDQWRGLNDDVYIASAGSAGSGALPEGTPNTYSIFRISARNTRVTIRQIPPSGKEMATYLSHELPITAT